MGNAGNHTKKYQIQIQTPVKKVKFVTGISLLLFRGNIFRVEITPEKA